MASDSGAVKKALMSPSRSVCSLQRSAARARMDVERRRLEGREFDASAGRPGAVRLARAIEQQPGYATKPLCQLSYYHGDGGGVVEGGSTAGSGGLRLLAMRMGGGGDLMAGGWAASSATVGDHGRCVRAPRREPGGSRAGGFARYRVASRSVIAFCAGRQNAMRYFICCSILRVLYATSSK